MLFIYTVKSGNNCGLYQSPAIIPNKCMFVNKNVDIKFSAHDAFLELPSSGTLKVKIFERQII